MSEHPSHGFFRDQTHVLPIRVYYEDTDFSGVVYHGAFVKFLERGRTEYLRAVGVHHKEMLVLDEPIAFTIQKLTIEYKRPGRIDEALEVRTVFYQSKGVRLRADQSVCATAGGMWTESNSNLIAAAHSAAARGDEPSISRSIWATRGRMCAIAAAKASALTQNHEGTGTPCRSRARRLAALPPHASVPRPSCRPGDRIAGLT